MSQALYQAMRNQIAETPATLPKTDNGNEKLIAALERFKGGPSAINPVVGEGLK